MALGTITYVDEYAFANRRAKVWDIVGPTSYTAGGEALTPAQLGFVAGSDIQVDVIKSVGGVDGTYDAANQKLKLFSGGAEASGNLSTTTFRVTATGKYPV